VSIIRTNKELVLPKFLNLLLTSRNYKDRLLNTGEKAGATRQALTKSHLEDFIILYPPIVEQRRLIKKLEEFASFSKLLEIKSNLKLSSLKELKQSLLQKAFTGGLTKDIKTNLSIKPNQQEQRATP
jgi:type I restriction enzyme S subunit